ncbi:Retrovirus-related Pol polyprotein from transposon 17.6 [Trichinella papuae]|uniref:Retrovirus-related Pol polyprotein from transposon 17.6 n=1 Tax=Trichinella papuae TaxID=268474 RepID=A0A0V1MVF8_9BILA|nr:Retrovirus-related Pol polyprotein from transposon 17.6 [Trichinella papuae]
MENTSGNRADRRFKIGKIVMVRDYTLRRMTWKRHTNQMRHKNTGIADGQEEKDNEVGSLLNEALPAGNSHNSADGNAQDIEASNVFPDQTSIPQNETVNSSPTTVHAESSSTTAETADREHKSDGSVTMKQDEVPQNLRRPNHESYRLHGQVWGRDFRSNQRRCSSAEIVKVFEPRHFIVKTETGLWKRHLDQLRRRYEEEQISLEHLPSSSDHNAVATSRTTMPGSLCHSQRSRQVQASHCNNVMRRHARDYRTLTWSSCLAYLDDIIVFGCTAQEHTDRLERVFQRIAETGLKLKPQKCHLMRKTVRFLGHVLSENGISTDEEKIRAVKEWPTPCCPSEVRQFLGLASYYRRSHWKWTAECQTAFDQLKHMLCTAPVLTFPDFNVPFIVDVDASAEGIGAVLSQLSHGNERVVAYASRTLTNAERRYYVTRKELLALVWSIKEFRPYLYGQHFDVRTDHSCLRWLRNFKEPEGQVARWLEQLAEYDFNVLHRPGRAHCNADALSRQRCPHLGISIVAAATLPVATMEEVAPSRCLSIVDIKTWLQAQSTDPTLSVLRSWLAANQWPRHCPTSSDPDLLTLWRDGRGVFPVDGNGLLRRRQASSDHVDDQLLVPKELRNDVLAAMHNTTFGGHFAPAARVPRETKRHGKPRRPYTCQKRPVRSKQWPWTFWAPWKRRPKVTVTFWSFAITSQNGQRRIQRAPKRPRKLPTVGNWFSRFGAPIRLHSDQGRSFESALISEVCKIFGVEKSRSSPYHPQGNGLVERANRTLLNTLAKLCHESQDRSWDQLLPLATMAYNSAVHETTGQSPFCMLFGKQMSLPLDVTLDVPPGTASNADDYVVQLRENLQKLHSTAFDRSRHEQQRHKEIADRKATANRFETGQLVWLKVPQKGKMDMRWSGPFRVLKQLGVETYRVQDVGRPRRRLVVHSDRLKAYHTGIDQEATAGGSEPPGGSGDVLRTTWTFKGPVVSPGMTGSHAQEDVRP